jgi:DNA-directed RNA polymerase specialized sigma24 family protein
MPSHTATVHAEAVRAQRRKLLALKETYGLSNEMLARRFEVTSTFVEKLLKEARLERQG